jgi:arginine repressor
VNSDVVSIGVPSTASAVLVLAVVFGAAQHLVTRYVDRRADEVLSTLAPDKTADA